MNIDVEMFKWGLESTLAVVEKAGSKECNLIEAVLSFNSVLGYGQIEVDFLLSVYW